MRQLWWRDFFTQLAWFTPPVFGRSLRPQYDGVAWPGSSEAFEAWCAARTGFPVIDAGMGELATTGWMHNRVRMLVASSLTKDLHVGWRKGARWFARQLVDYDPAVDNGNRQWAASTGVGTQPYFRIFNPWTQQRKFDPEGRHVKRWVPELADVAPTALHRLEQRRPATVPDEYPRPMVAHREASRRALERFEDVLAS